MWQELFMAGTAASIATLAGGALIGFISTYLIQVVKERHDLRQRWDVSLLNTCTQIASTARRLAHAARRHPSDTGARAAAVLERIDEHHEALRALTEEIRLLGDAQVQRWALLVQRHGYAVRMVGEGRPDPRGDEFPGLSPEDRLYEALAGFYVAVRRQLRVASPDDVIPRL
jgi:hypothetical protein